MCTTNCKKFKGEIENYVRKTHDGFESQLDRAFSALRLRTLLSRTNIKKHDGYHAAHVLFTLTLLPIFKLKTVHSFCQKQWHHWSPSKKDTFYRFKRRGYRWRTFAYKVISEIGRALNFDRYPLEKRYFVIDDTILAKRGRCIENVSYIFDHNLGRSVVGFCVVTLGLFTGQGFYPIDFSYRFGKTRHPKSPEEKIGDHRSISGQRSFEAKHSTKLDLAFMMIQRAVDAGIGAGYVLFDSWYAWPVLINGIRAINESLHVICRLKDSKVQYKYQGKKYRLSELYQKVRHRLTKNARTGLFLKRVTVRLPQSDEDAVIVFCKGYHEPEDNTITGKKKAKKPRWVAFLSTDTRLHASTVIKKYTRRWAVEVCFKECKQLLDLGKDQSNDFDAQVFATTASFLRHNLLSFLSERTKPSTVGSLFEHLADDTAVVTYAQRLWNFFQGLFRISFSSIFELFKIEDDFHSYIDALGDVITQTTPFQGCET